MRYDKSKAALRLLTERNEYTGMTLTDKQTLQQARNRMKNVLCNRLGYTDIQTCVDALQTGLVSAHVLLSGYDYQDSDTFEQRYNSLMEE